MDSNIKYKLDFVCVGVQKGGTTALHEYLKEHNDISLPFKDKESPFFCYEETEVNDLVSQFDEKKWSRSKVRGKISPQYMSYLGSVKALYNYNPNLKIIIVLRNPISRLISHYKMCLKRGFVSGDINSFIESYLIKNQVTGIVDFSIKEKFVEEEIAGIIGWGKYGSIIREYFKYFPQNSFLFLKSSNLNNKTKGTLLKVYNFLDVNKDYPQSMNKKHHITKDNRYLPSLYKIKHSFVGKVMRFVVPTNIRTNDTSRKLYVWYNDFFSFKSKKSFNISDENKKQLRLFYYKDFQLIIADSSINDELKQILTDIMDS